MLDRVQPDDDVRTVEPEETKTRNSSDREEVTEKRVGKAE